MVAKATFSSSEAERPAMEGAGPSTTGCGGAGMRAGSSGGDGIEDGGGGDAVGEVQLADAEGGVAIAEDAVEHHLDLVGGELDGGDGGGGFDHLGRDGGPAAEVGLWGSLRGGGVGGESEEGAGEERAAEAGGGGDGEKAAAGGVERLGGGERLLHVWAHFGMVHRNSGGERGTGVGLL